MPPVRTPRRTVAATALPICFFEHTYEHKKGRWQFLSRKIGHFPESLLESSRLQHHACGRMIVRTEALFESFRSWMCLSYHHCQRTKDVALFHFRAGAEPRLRLRQRHDLLSDLIQVEFSFE